MDAAAGGGPSGNVGRLADPLLAAANGDLVGGGKHQYWVPVDEKCGGEDDHGRPLPLYHTFRVKGILINLYRCVRQLCSVFLFSMCILLNEVDDTS
jgi:hypothetical protein